MPSHSPPLTHPVPFKANPKSLDHSSSSSPPLAPGTLTGFFFFLMGFPSASSSAGRDTQLWYI